MQPQKARRFYDGNSSSVQGFSQMFTKKFSFYLWLSLSSIGGVAVAIGLLFIVVMGLIKASKPFKMAIADLESSGKVSQALGSDWRQGLFVFGEVSIHGDTGHACLTIPVQGTSNQGKAYLDAHKLNGEWVINELALELMNGHNFEDIFVVAATPEHPKVCGMRAVDFSNTAVQ